MVSLNPRIGAQSPAITMSVSTFRFPGYSQARYNMAVVLRKMGERAMAAENFRQFLKEDPFHPLSSKAQEFIAEIEKEEQ